MKSKNIRTIINLIEKSILGLCTILLVFFVPKSFGLSSSLSSSLNSFHTKDQFGDILIVNDFIVEKDTTIFGISINLNEGWHSYWRHAGDIGLPTRIYFDYQPKLNGHKVFWPKPTVKDNDFGISLVYEENVIIPVLINVPKAELPLALMLNLELGVCKDICIPIKKRIKIDIDKPNRSLQRNHLRSVLAEIKKSQIKLHSKNFYCSIDMRQGNTFLDFNIKLPDEYSNSLAILEYDKDLIDVINIEEKIEGNSLIFSILMDQSQLSSFVISKSQFTLHFLSKKNQTSVFGCF